MNPNHFRIGNIVYIPKTDQIAEVTAVHKHIGVIVNDSLQWIPFNSVKPVELTEERLSNVGFKKPNHFTVNGSMKLEIANNKYILIGDIGTPNEMVCIKEGNDVVVIRNYDYHGKTYLHDIQNIYHALTGQELTLQKTNSNLH